jgi:hypothetical protein
MCVCICVYVCTCAQTAAHTYPPTVHVYMCECDCVWGCTCVCMRDCDDCVWVNTCVTVCGVHEEHHMTCAPHPSGSTLSLCPPLPLLPPPCICDFDVCLLVERHGGQVVAGAEDLHA